MVIGHQVAKLGVNQDAERSEATKKAKKRTKTKCRNRQTRKREQRGNKYQEMLKFKESIAPFYVFIGDSAAKLLNERHSMENLKFLQLFEIFFSLLSENIWLAVLSEKRRARD